MKYKEQFNRWILEQLTDPSLRKIVQERMKQASAEVIVTEVGAESGVLPDACDTAQGGAAPWESEAVQRWIDRHAYRPDGYWLERLFTHNLFYEAQTEQLTKQSGLLFEHLAQFINALFYERKHQREWDESEARWNEVLLDLPTLERLYREAQRAVRSHYAGDGSPVEPFRSGYWGRRLGETRMEAVAGLAERVLAGLPQMDAATQSALGYTENGFKITWWDPCGALRQEVSYTPKQLARYAPELRQKTFFWSYPCLVKRALCQYDRVCDTLENELREGRIPWRNLSMKRYLQRLTGGMMRADRAQRYHFSDVLLRLCEQSVRRSIGGMPLLREESLRLELKRRLPTPIEQAVLDCLEHESIPPLSAAEVFLLEKGLRNGRAILTAWVRTQARTPEKWILLFNGCTAKDALRILQGMAPLSADSLQRLCFYLEAAVKGSVSKAHRSEMNRLIHPSQQAAFALLCKQGALLTDASRTNWASELSEKLEALAKPRLRRVHLDRTRVVASRLALEKTVSLIERFVDAAPEDLSGKATGEAAAAQSELGKEERADREQGLTSAQKELLAQILLQMKQGAGGVDEAWACQWARSRGRSIEAEIADLNEQLFEELGVELLFWTEGQLAFDPSDAAWVKEQLSPEKTEGVRDEVRQHK